MFAPCDESAKEAARHESNEKSGPVREVGPVADVRRFWLAGESSALAAGPDGSAPAAKTVVSGDVSLAAPEHDEKLAVQAAAQATSPVVRTVAVGMDAGDYTETVTCDYTPVYVDDRFGGYCYVLDDAVWLPADAFAEMLGLESDTVTDGDTETVTVDGADIAATYGETYYTANGRCFYAPDGVYALDGEVVLPLADLEKIFGVTAAFSADNTSLRVDASEQALLESGESYYGARDVYWLSHIINAEAGNQPMDGQIAVGNVVLNRVADERFPNSVKEVVFDRRGGVAQFSPTADGRISLTPDEDAELAAKLAFEGYDPVGESLYFINPSACNASWFNSRLTYTATTGDHVRQCSRPHGDSCGRFFMTGDEGAPLFRAAGKSTGMSLDRFRNFGYDRKITTPKEVRACTTTGLRTTMRSACCAAASAGCWTSCSAARWSSRCCSCCRSPSWCSVRTISAATTPR